MNSTRHFLITLSQTYLAVVLSLAPAQAFSLIRPHPTASPTQISSQLMGQLRQDQVVIWKGQGRIVQGTGQGGEVKLTLHFDRNRVWTPQGQGPPLNQPVNANTLNGAILQDGIRTWAFRQCGNGLCISVSQRSPQQVIRYVLYKQ